MDVSSCNTYLFGSHHTLGGPLLEALHDVKPCTIFSPGLGDLIEPGGSPQSTDTPVHVPFPLHGDQDLSTSFWRPPWSCIRVLLPVSVDAESLAEGFLHEPPNPNVSQSSRSLSVRGFDRNAMLPAFGRLTPEKKNGTTIITEHIDMCSRQQTCALGIRRV